MSGPADAVVEVPLAPVTMPASSIEPPAESLLLARQSRRESSARTYSRRLPIVLGQGVFLIGTLLDSQICISFSPGQDGAQTRAWFGSIIHFPLQAGALITITNAQRLYQFPLGVLAISLATAALPMFSQYAAQRDFAGLRSEFRSRARLRIIPKFSFSMSRAPGLIRRAALQCGRLCGACGMKASRWC